MDKTVAITIVTALLTAFFGVLVFVAGQFIQRFLLEPIQEQRKAIGEVVFNLTFLGNVDNAAVRQERELLSTRIVDADDAAKTLRTLAGQLRASLWTIPCYDRLAWIRLVPPRKVIV